MIPSSSPNAAQGRWLERVANYGSCIDGNPCVEVHHCVGRSAKHNKVPVGHWFVIPLTSEQHRWIHQDLERFRSETFFFDSAHTRKDMEKILFSEMVSRHGMGEMPQEAYEAIMDYRK